jgi:hypothetical protein
MKEISATLHQETCAGSSSATSSQESACGATRSASQAGRTISPSGPAPALASHSARQAAEMGLLMSGTYGQRGSTSSKPIGLSSSLGNRLQVVTASLGSTLYKMTWKTRTTPAGRSIFALRASVPRTSAKGSGSSPAKAGWPTPVATEIGNTLENYLAMKANMRSGPRQAITHPSLAAQLAHWPTPRAEDSESSGARWGRGTFDTLTAVTHNLAHWPTPMARDWKGDGASPRTKGRQLPFAGNLAHWPTPQANNATRGGSEQRATNPERSADLHDYVLLAAYRLPKKEAFPARLTATGEMLTGSAAGMESGGQLSPAHSRWLMGLPPAWDACGVTAMQSFPKRQRKSSKP